MSKPEGLMPANDDAPATKDNNLSTHDAIKALAAKSIASGEVAPAALKGVAAKVIAMVESARKDEGTVALMKEVRKAYGLPPK